MSSIRTKDNFGLGGSATSFVVSVGPGVLIPTSGTPFTYSGGTVSATANATNYIYILTTDGTLTASTSVDSTLGTMLGVVTAGATGITNITQGLVDEDGTSDGLPNPLEVSGKASVGGVVVTEAALALYNNSVAVAESASVTSTRLVTLTGSVATINHRVADFGFHCNLAGFTMAHVAGSYGGTYINGAGGTCTYSAGLSGLVQVDETATITTAVGVDSAAATLAAGSTITNLYGFRFGLGGAVGTVTNGYGVRIGDFTGATFTAAFSTDMASGTGKWGIHCSGTADNYLRGNTKIANSGTGIGVLQMPAVTTGTGTGIGWGTDVELFRGGADTLQTPDSFIAADIFCGSSSEFRVTSRGKWGMSADGDGYIRNNGSTAPARISLGCPSSVNITSGSLTALQCGRNSYHNVGATALTTITLPAYQAGLEVSFVVLDADGYRVQTGTAEQIRVAASISTATTGYIQSTTIGDSITLRGVGGFWVAVSMVGVGWSVT